MIFFFIPNCLSHLSEVVYELIISCREKSKRYSEQGAAAVCLHALGVVDKTYGFVPADGARKYLHVINEGKNESEKSSKRESLENEDPEANCKKVTDCKKRKLESNIFQRTCEVKHKEVEKGNDSSKRIGIRIDSGLSWWKFESD